MELKQLCNLNHPKRNDCIRCYHWENPDDIHCGYDAQHTEYLISIGIDVFDAIGKGWAVRREAGNETI